MGLLYDSCVFNKMLLIHDPGNLLFNPWNANVLYILFCVTKYHSQAFSPTTVFVFGFSFSDYVEAAIICAPVKIRTERGVNIKFFPVFPYDDKNILHDILRLLRVF